MRSEPVTSFLTGFRVSLLAFQVSAMIVSAAGAPAAFAACRADVGGRRADNALSNQNTR